MFRKGYNVAVVAAISIVAAFMFTGMLYSSPCLRVQLGEGNKRIADAAKSDIIARIRDSIIDIVNIWTDKIKKQRSSKESDALLCVLETILYTYFQDAIFNSRLSVVQKELEWYDSGKDRYLRVSVIEEKLKEVEDLLEYFRKNIDKIKDLRQDKEIGKMVQYYIDHPSFDENITKEDIDKLDNLGYEQIKTSIMSYVDDLEKLLPELKKDFEALKSAIPEKTLTLEAPASPIDKLSSKQAESCL